MLKVELLLHFPIRHLLAQGQQWKHQSNVGKPFKVNNKDTRIMSLISLGQNTAIKPIV